MKSTCSTVSLSMERIVKFVNLPSVIVDLRYVIMSFILENERSQPATEIDTVNRICSPAFKWGNTSFPLNDTVNLRIPRGVTSTPTRLLTRIRQSCISSARRAPSTSSGNAVAKSVHFLCKSSRSIASAVSYTHLTLPTKRIV